MTCPTFKCPEPECVRVHECNRGDPHPPEGMHIEYEAMVDHPPRYRGVIRPSAVRIRAVWEGESAHV